MGRVEHKLFGGPLGLKGLVGVTILALGLIVGGCWGIVALMTSKPRPVEYVGSSRGARGAAQTADAQDMHLLECDAAEPPSEDDAIYIERAGELLDETLADLNDEEFRKKIKDDYLSNWIVKPGWVGKITRIIQSEGSAGPRSIVTILEGGGRIPYKATIRAVTAESVSGLRVGDRVYVRGWICDMTPPISISTTRGKAQTTPGVIFLARATINRA